MKLLYQTFAEDAGVEPAIPCENWFSKPTRYRPAHPPFLCAVVRKNSNCILRIVLARHFAARFPLRLGIWPRLRLFQRRDFKFGLRAKFHCFAVIF